MKNDELVKGTKRIRKLNEILSELTLQELEYLYIALPAIIKLEKEKKNEI